MKRKWVWGTAIVFFAILVRFYNFSGRVIFGPEQAISLMASGEILQGKFTLLGIQNLQRFTSGGHQLFSGAWFTYSLLPFQLLFGGDPILITGYFAVLNVVTGLILFYLVRKIVNFKTTIIFLVLFLFNSLMIYHSLFIWILNYLPLVGGLSFYFLYEVRRKSSWLLGAFWLGLLSGIGFSLEYFYVFSALAIFLLLVIFSKKRVSAVFCFFIGAVIGNLPMVLFDIRHNFYHVKTLWWYFLDMFVYPSNQNLSYYHFLNWLPLVLLLLAISLQKYLSGYKVAIILLLYIVGNLFSGRVAFNKAVGMPVGLIWDKINQAAEIVSGDNPKDFNVVTLLDFDTRGHILRYPLKYLYNDNPLSVENYREVKVIYALARTDYNFDNPQVWELQTIMPYKVDFLSEINGIYGVFKLTKQ
jgi:hypothetical protein